MRDRYHRQTLLPQVGEAGDQRLARAHAVIVGIGALGTVSAQILVRAGVGTVTLIDRDVVERTNLQRQVLFDEHDAHNATPKSLAAASRLRAINSDVRIRAAVCDVHHTNAASLLGFEPAAHATPIDDDRAHEPLPPPSVIIDGTDNVETRLLINDISVSRRTPWVYAGAVSSEARLCVFDPRDGSRPCFRCLFPDVPPPGALATCDTAGVFAPTTSLAGSWQAGEAIKLLLGDRAAASPHMLSIDLMTSAMRTIDVTGARDPECPCCARADFAYLEGGAGSRTESLCGRDAVQIAPRDAHAIDLVMLSESLRSVAEVRASRFVLRARLRDEAIELSVFPDGRAIVGGTDSPERARAVYARYVGA
ncbi:MAG: ThiF family adenylyltransferase [Planctomycetota bacterium]